MSFVIILATSIVVFLLFRLIILLACSVAQKVLKLPDSNVSFSLVLSIAFFFMYLEGFLGAVQGVMGKANITNWEWYLIYTFIGISAMLWCYFSWDFKWKAKPQFGKDGSQTTVKKIIVFSAVMIFAFYQGYTQLETNFGGGLEESKEMLVTVTNITIIPGIIALDRVLNQIKDYIKLRK